MHSAVSRSTLCPARRHRCARRRGAALVEFAIVFPVQLLVVLGIIQLSLAFGAQQVVQYASYCSARAAIVGLDPEKAGQLALLPVTWAPLTEAESHDQLSAEVKREGDSQLGTAGSRTTTRSDVDKVQMTWSSHVEHHFELKIPVIGTALTGNGPSAFLPWTDVSTERGETIPPAT